jgi:hypothetical protein
MSELEAAVKTEADRVGALEAALAELDGELAEMRREQNKLQYAIHAEHDEAARKAYDKLQSKVDKLMAERAGKGSAVETARARHLELIGAQQAAEAQAESARVVALFDRLVEVYDHLDKVFAELANGMHAAAEVERLIVEAGLNYPPSPNLQERLRLATVLHHEFPAGWARAFENRPPDRQGGRPPVNALGPIATGWRDAIVKRLGIVASEAAE